MRLGAKGVLLCLLLLLSSARVALTQGQRTSANGTKQVSGKSPGRPRNLSPSRTLNPEEGLAILGAALDSRHRAGFPSDCSHLVHELYGRAGFPYEYASSSELFAGANQFRRVANPQPGDLAVWRGHAGIVVNPVQHSFFSLLRSGPGVDSYDSPYWNERGRPRFFRYVKATPGGTRSSSIRPTRLKPASANTEPHDPAANDPGLDVSEESAPETRSTGTLAEGQPVGTTSSVSGVHSVHPKPEKLGATFLQACTDSEAHLRGRDLLRLAQPVIVFDHFEAKKVQIAGNQNWVEVQIVELISLAGGKAELHKRSERQRWPLSQGDNKGWVLTPSRDAIYLPRHIAVRLLAHELAQLTDDGSSTDGRTQERAELARALDVLLGK
jgi:hypothetical protein